MIVLSKMP